MVNIDDIIVAIGSTGNVSRSLDEGLTWTISSDNLLGRDVFLIWKYAMM